MNTNEEPHGLIEPASNEIISTSIDLSVDYAELSLDSFLETGILKEIPFVKSIYSIYKLGVGIKEFHFTKKFMTFLREFHSQTIADEKLNEFKQKFRDDRKYREKITETLIIYNDAFLQVEKSRILAKLFSAYIEGKFDWDHFNHLSVCLNVANPKIFSFLDELSKNDFQVPENKPEGMVLKLDMQAMVIASGLGYTSSVWSSGFKLSDLGKDLYNFGLR